MDEIIPEGGFYELVGLHPTLEQIKLLTSLQGEEGKSPIASFFCTNDRVYVRFNQDQVSDEALFDAHKKVADILEQNQ